MGVFGSNQPKNTFYCYLIEMRAERTWGEGGKCVHPTQIASSAWEKRSLSTYFIMPLADTYLPQKASHLKGQKKYASGWKVDA